MTRKSEGSREAQAKTYLDKSVSEHKKSSTEKILGHKNVQTTLIYVDLETTLFEETNDEFLVRVATNTKEVCQFVEAGFEYVTEEYNDGGKIFRKRK